LTLGLALVGAQALADELQGTTTVTPYGLVTTNGVYSDVATNNADNPQLLPAAGTGSTALSARQSRLGLKAARTFGEGELKAVGGTVELDFYGATVGQGLGAFFPLPRLRLAYASAQFGWGNLKLVAGQDWVTFAPLNPESSLHVAVPGFAQAGNLWARAPQIRLEGSTSGAWSAHWSVAVLDDAETDPKATDQTTVSSVRLPQAGEHTKLPAGEARLALEGTLFDRPLAVGVSGHIAQREWILASGNVDTASWGAAVDLVLPLGRMLSLKAEGFVGEDLASFMGGVNQGVRLTTTAGAITGVSPVHSMGGWAQLVAKPLDNLTIAAGPGVDSPQRGDLPAVGGALKYSPITSNLAVYASANYELSKGFLLGVEYNYMHTEYLSGATPTGTVVALNAQYAF
jgi:hypothetical protein